MAGDAQDDWTLPPDQRKKARKELSDWAELLIAGLAAAVVAALPDLVAEGDAWGGGGADDEQLVELAAAAIESQGGYADGFLDEMNARIDEVLGAGYADQEAFLDAVMDMFGWAKSRAESYAAGAGVPAWREGAAAAMKRNGVQGGHWICTFGPGSCADCRELHGQWMTLDELKATWGTTACNGGCLCGFMPGDDPAGLGDDELDAVDADAGDGLGEAA